MSLQEVGFLMVAGPLAIGMVGTGLYAVGWILTIAWKEERPAFYGMAALFLYIVTAAGFMMIGDD